MFKKETALQVEDSSLTEADHSFNALVNEETITMTHIGCKRYDDDDLSGAAEA